MPELSKLAAGAAKITFSYAALPDGAQISYATNDPILVDALHRWFVAVFDGVNSTLAEFDLPHLYAPTNLLRLLTGLLSGIALAPFLVWLSGAIALPQATESEGPVLRSTQELVAPLMLNGLFALLVMHEHAVLYYPIALISVAGVVGVLAIVALLVILALGGRAGQVTRLHQLIAPGALAIL